MSVCECIECVCVCVEHVSGVCGCFCECVLSNSVLSVFVRVFVYVCIHGFVNGNFTYV